MCMEKTPWEKAVEFHGHACPGLAIGFRAAELAMDALRGDRSSDEELIAVVENNSCGVDAVQSLTGCSFGKGNLFFKDYGKQVYTFARRKDGNAIRVAIKHGSFFDPEFQALRERVNAGNASAEDREAYHRALNSRIQKILEAKDEFDVRMVKIKMPAKASIYQTVQCAQCGEGVMEPRARLKGGRVFCLPCFEGE